MNELIIFFFIIVISLILINKLKQNKDIVLIKSNIDNRKYLVRKEKNSQDASDKLANIMPVTSDNNESKKYFHSILLRKMDAVFLEIISNHPEYMKNALMDLFRTKKHNPQIRFLSDTPTILDILKIIIYLPKIKFMQYALGIKKNLNDK